MSPITTITAGPTFTDEQLRALATHVRVYDAAVLDDLDMDERGAQLGAAAARVVEQRELAVSKADAIRDAALAARKAAHVAGRAAPPASDALVDAERTVAMLRADFAEIEREATELGKRRRELRDHVARAKQAILVALATEVHREIADDLRAVHARHVTRLEMLGALPEPIDGRRHELPLGEPHPVPVKVMQVVAFAHPVSDGTKFWLADTPRVDASGADEWFSEILGRVRDLGDAKAA